MKSFAWHILSLIAFLASLSVNARADIYQFVDDSGVVHFTNAPGGQVKKFAKVHVEPRGPASSSNSPERNDRI